MRTNACPRDQSIRTGAIFDLPVNKENVAAWIAMVAKQKGDVPRPIRDMMARGPVRPLWLASSGWKLDARSRLLTSGRSYGR